MSNPKFAVPGGATPIPNWLLDDRSLTATQKLVLIGYHRSAFGPTTTTKTSENQIARSMRLDRKTVPRASAFLMQGGYLTTCGETPNGFATQYEIALEPPPGNPHHTPMGNGTIPPGESTHNIKSSKNIQDDAPPNASLEGQPVEDEIGNCSPSATDARKVLHSKQMVNDALLTPEGLRASDDPDEASNLLNCGLAQVCGEPLNPREEERLLVEYGARLVSFWSHWLPRKVAAEYGKGKPVASPAGMLKRALEQDWKVDPAWPPFDDVLHTVAAREAAERRARERGSESVEKSEPWRHMNADELLKSVFG
jgi:hypothetical protein